MTKKPKLGMLIWLVAAASFLPSYGRAQAVYCPQALPQLTLEGPRVSTDIYGKTTAECRYLQDNRLKGTVTSHYYKDHAKYKECGSPEYLSAEFMSQHFRAYSTFSDADPEDDLSPEYWRLLAFQFLENTEDLALECGNTKRKIKRPLQSTR